MVPRGFPINVVKIGGTVAGYGSCTGVRTDVATARP
jgi:hypothetical protein